MLDLIEAVVDRLQDVEQAVTALAINTGWLWLIAVINLVWLAVLTVLISKQAPKAKAAWAKYAKPIVITAVVVIIAIALIWYDQYQEAARWDRLMN